ncbi:MAG: histidine phosphatase family protein [Deferribacteres bacterium]|nr:histidine phosphatase family protein [Deferribacteres bacterium]
MVTEVCLIRHGETVDADSARYKGHIEVPLSGHGMQQMRKLADYLARNGRGKLKAVYSSCLGRAVKSAEIIAGPHGIQPVVVEGLKERNFGAWEGMTFDEIRRTDPGAFKAWAEDPLRFSPPGGESTIDFSNRALKAFNAIVSAHPGDSIAVVAHGGINRVILCHLLGIPLENIFRIEQDFAALNIIEFWDYPVVKLMNFRVA